ncbi:2-hydroxyacid dehydrogenase [Nocardiopsis sp. NPDC050513]|uniref:2-hydroxyacid dehydrogenase n=1 Tax=Nocardiopsis sp. NPDC050513 TaxID=3364338 RepID=UPI00378E2BD7
MTTTVLAAGDRFVLPGLLSDAVRARVGADVEVRELELPWPHVPFGPVAEVQEASGTEEELVTALRGARVCVTQMAPLTERVLAACPDLELFCVGRGGPVNANLDAATRHGVAVCFAPGRNAAATAEHTLGLILAAARRIPDLHADLRAGRWRGDFYDYDNCGVGIEGAAVGLVGYGAIGRRVAAALSALGARVLVYDPYVAEDALPESAARVSLGDLLAQARIVSLHARLTAETEGLIGADEIAAMRPGAVLVNCARGGLVDYGAVRRALESGHLHAAAFDVYPEEPVPPGSGLLRAPNVVLTPHVAGASRQVAHTAAGMVADEVGRLLDGRPLAHCANPAVLDADGVYRNGR